MTTEPGAEKQARACIKRKLWEAMPIPVGGVLTVTSEPPTVIDEEATEAAVAAALRQSAASARDEVERLREKLRVADLTIDALHGAEMRLQEYEERDASAREKALREAEAIARAEAGTIHADDAINEHRREMIQVSIAIANAIAALRNSQQTSHEERKAP